MIEIDKPIPNSATQPENDGIVHLKRRAVLELYDNYQKDGGFATALSALAGEEMAIALLEHYLVSVGQTVKRIPGIPKTGQQKGRRLDGWLEINGQLAQIEVKNWGANAIGGKPYSGKPDVGWQQFLAWWKSTPGLRKVLHAMQPPQEKDYAGRKVELAIVCMWPVMHAKGEAGSYFSVDVSELSPLDNPPEFSELHVFSMSAYLHALQAQTIDLAMPKTYARLKKIETLLGVSGTVLSAE